jgi:N6-L-threonylcarbamoyladenine synthase
LENITGVVNAALQKAGVGFTDLSGIAVTVGPGLIGPLLVGVAAAKAYAFARQIPLLVVNHIEAHIYANFLAHPSLEPPFACLVVSGGHTSLVLVREHLCYELLGSTRDDAAGEAFDKIARVLGLPYPGGPAVEELAREGNPRAVSFPRAWLGEESLDFSFSGLKTAVINYLRQMKERGEDISPKDVAASFQEAAIEVLVEKTLRAARASGVIRVALAGGVAANLALRALFQTRAQEEGIQFYFPPRDLCTDNAAMVACAGYYHYLSGRFAPLNQEAFARYPLIRKI